MKRLVTYSIAVSDPEREFTLTKQVVASIRSLRAHNRSIPIVLYLYCDMPQLVSDLESSTVTVIQKGLYKTQLAKVSPKCAEVLSRHPVLHKLLNFAEIDEFDPDQLLLLDCDTLFFDDVERLFANYKNADCYAREEHSCKRSARGYDPEYLDEGLLAKLARSEGVSPIPPFNTGLLLFNNKFWRKIDIQLRFISYVWRLSVWMALHRQEGPAQCHDGAIGVDFLRDHLREYVKPEDERAALMFPSGNRWIVDEVALWFTLGTIPNFRYEDFSKRDVLQGGEIIHKAPRDAHWIASHYYSINTSRLVDWLKRYLPPIEDVSNLVEQWNRCKDEIS
jgi:hypothetical protein